jgi:peptidoglycan/LPS O-acetylase OafA/YrhL
LINAKTAYLGKATYSMYLFHPLIIFSILPAYLWIYGIMPGDISGISGLSSDHVCVTRAGIP